MNLAISFGEAFRRVMLSIVLLASGPMGLPCREERATISVIAHDAANAVVPGATARLLSLDRVLQGASGPAGELRFNNVIPGVYDLEVSAKGFLTQTIRNVSVAGDARPIEVDLTVANQQCGFINTVDYEAFSAVSARLRGRVIDEDSGKGLKSVDVMAVRDGADTGSILTRSGASGYFAFPDLPAGRYSVYASKNAYFPTELSRFFVPRQNVTILGLGLDKRGHMHVCQ